MNALILIDTVKSRSALNALHAARYRCVYKAQYAHALVADVLQKLLRTLSQDMLQTSSDTKSTAAMPRSTTDKPLAKVETT